MNNNKINPMPEQTAFNLPYLKAQLKLFSEKPLHYEAGEYLVSYNITVGQMAFIKLIIADCIHEMETVK